LKKALHILLIALTCCEGCKKDDPKPLTELEKLPPATQSGKNTFGCLVNGKAWVPVSSTDATAVYQQGILQIGGHLYNPTQVIGVSLIENGFPIQPGSYSLTELPQNTADVSIWGKDNNPCIYDEKNTLSGVLTVTRIDMVSYIVSGIFEFSTVTSGCDTLKITNGRFDLKYIP
jgi:hypothetical protein